MTPSEPGITGQPAALAVAFAFALSPKAAIDWEEGPMKVRPQLSQMEAKLAR